MLNKFLKNESGATAIEYALIAALLSIVIIGAVTFVGTGITNTFSKVGSTLSSASL